MEKRERYEYYFKQGGTRLTLFIKSSEEAIAAK